MKPISANLKTHIAGEVTNLATCWKITRRDSVVLGFTDHDTDIMYDSVIYQAASGFSPSAVADNSELAVDNMDVEGVLDSASIAEADIHAGLYDFAEIEVFMINYLDTSQGILSLRTGWIGEVKYGKNRFVAEVRGLMQSFAQNIGQLYSPSCRAILGDSRCGINLSGYTVSSTVTSISDRQIFSDSTRAEAKGYFDSGKITFTSGNNNGLSMEIKTFTDGVITMVFPLPYDIEIGDSYTMIAGCDKNFSTCVAKYNNAVNFRGEPHIPGIDRMLETAGTRSG